MDSFSKSDPFARLVIVGEGGSETEVGRTEVIQDTQTPKWAQGIKLDYHFEESRTVEQTVATVLLHLHLLVFHKEMCLSLHIMHSINERYINVSGSRGSLGQR